ncbi:type III restriction-modification system endonuclease [Puerhibacterium sp. TATVAM-FAB25]|uniref:type III restriction-modification system endonuclease n=1 Tax=Puerhibacterium sp. TATVAM-FAB25 TaxID=3093699 RepID=UPI003979991E
MRLQFKVQQYQTDAVDAVVDVFAGQPKDSGEKYTIDPGRRAAPRATTDGSSYVPIASGGQGELVLGGVQSKLAEPERADSGLRNREIVISPQQVLEQIQSVQRARSLPLSTSLAKSPAAPAGVPNLDVEMETGTGKTYVYIKTIMELNRRYGWSKFIVVVPSVAIREGVKKSFDITAEHFQQTYGTKPRSFVYNSSQLHELERFSSDAGVQVMIINIQAFNSTGADNRRIYGTRKVNARGVEELVGLDDFGSRKPIDVIAANRPILIIDEPQRISAARSQESLSRFNPLMVLRYSATHRVEHNKVHRLDALDAYNEKLVKRIAVRGVTVKGLAGSTAYMYVDSIEVAKGSLPRARVEIEVQTAGGIRRQLKRVDKGTNLHALSNGIEAYKDLVVVDIDATRDVVELSNGDLILAGQITQDVSEETKRRIQIREVIGAHLSKERELFARGIKVLSLFFIDEVAKYRDYDRVDTKGQYARIFEEEYALAREAALSELDLEPGYREYLRRDAAADIHAGYFSIDKRSGRQVDGAINKKGDEKGESKDTDAYDLILKDKERLLSPEEPVRFLFSHSALREGWDNPNVFVMGMLKRSDNTVSRRQEIGRGLRLSVDRTGERQDHPSTVHEINELTVVTDESYTSFVEGLQKEIAATLASRPKKASVKFFTGKTFTNADGVETVVAEQLATAFYNYLVKADYIDDSGAVTQTYQDAKAAEAFVSPTNPLLAPVIDGLWPLVDMLYLDVPITDGRKPKKIPLNDANFGAFQDLWGQINHKAVYQVEFDSDELIGKCVKSLDKELKVAAMQYVVTAGQQLERIEADELTDGESFETMSTEIVSEAVTAGSTVAYDLLGEIAEKTQLTRRTCAAILSAVQPATFAKFRLNPEQFITETARIVNEQKATVIVEHLTYDALDDRFDSSIFTANQTKEDFAKAKKLAKHIYDYVVTDSGGERSFVESLDVSKEVKVYAKLPRGFFIPTPVGDYNPDWAIAFHDGKVKHIYFVAETKGSLSTLQLRGVEGVKIDCARKFFEALNAKNADNVEYNVVTDYDDLMNLVKE